MSENKFFFFEKTLPGSRRPRRDLGSLLVANPVIPLYAGSLCAPKRHSQESVRLHFNSQEFKMSRRIDRRTFVKTGAAALLTGSAFTGVETAWGRRQQESNSVG